ncbi:hypothetical protein EOD39_12156 [Acipenser ruthenus]|uniref:Uncharacterized protein n=1 Tax=Acipenser ruthenus TaxID=7906 RepID=A0A662YR52_ACIRT|nr:hypothetical protein EOD39_12156 [Acipenser ruthenus]
MLRAQTRYTVIMRIAGIQLDLAGHASVKARHSALSIASTDEQRTPKCRAPMCVRGTPKRRALMVRASSTKHRSACIEHRASSTEHRSVKHRASSASSAKHQASSTEVCASSAEASSTERRSVERLPPSPQAQTC